MLQTVTSTVLVHRERALVRLGVGRLERIPELHARREALPGVVRLHPPPPALERALGAVVDVVEMVVDKLDALVEARLVVPVQVGQVDFQPPQTPRAERLRLSEEEQPAAEVVADVAQVRRDGICAPTEVDVMREVDGVAKELEKSFSFSKRRQRKKGGRLQHEQSRPCS